MTNWTSERALGFVIGAGSMLFLVAEILSDQPATAGIAGVALIVIGVFAPRVRD